MARRASGGSQKSVCVGLWRVLLFLQQDEVVLEVRRWIVEEVSGKTDIG